MLFDFNPEQHQFDDSVRNLLARHMTPAHLRAAWDSGHDHTSSIWPSLVSMGLTGLVAPESAGGLGGSLIDLALPLEQCGRHCVPEPIVESLVVAPLVLADHVSDATTRWLERLVSGDALATANLMGGSIVPDGGRADITLVRDGHELHLVPQDLVTATPMPSADPTRRLAECTYELGEDTLLTADPAAAIRAGDLGAAGTASMLVGLSQHLLETTRDYLLQREQFGVPIGSFQALKHRLADVAVATEAARSLSWYAAYALSVRSEDASVAASMAKGAASSAAHLANSAALQLHGGIGFTWEHDLHLWLQRGRAWETSFGTVSDHRAAVAKHAVQHHPRLSTSTP